MGHGLGCKIVFLAWTLSWVAVYDAPINCPESWPVNEYSGQQTNPFTGKPAMDCTHKGRREMSRTFYTEKEMDAFKGHCPKDTCFQWKSKEIKG